MRSITDLSWREGAILDAKVLIDHLNRLVENLEKKQERDRYLKSWEWFGKHLDQTLKEMDRAEASKTIKAVK